MAPIPNVSWRRRVSSAFINASALKSLHQFQDTAYVLGADIANPASVYMYNFLASSWSQQAVITNGFNPASWNGILDHDTNVICV